MFKLLISSLMMVMLAGCVSPYYPMGGSAYGTNEVAGGAPYQGAYNNNGYYENSYAGPSAYVQSSAYLDAAYYPYWSTDYFYLGSHYYRPAYGTSFSISLSSGYPYYGPYYYPGYYSSGYAPYAYYNPWFGMHDSWGGGYGRYDPYWRHGYGGHAWRSPRYGHSGGYDRGHDSGGYDRGHGSYRDDERAGNHAGARSGRDPRQVGDYRQGGRRVVQDREPPLRDRADRGRAQPARANRNVSVAPSTASTDRGMVVVNRGDGKPEPNRLGPVSRQGSGYRSRPPATGTVPAVSGYPSGPARIVAPGDNKTDRSRTGIPVRSGNSAPAVWVNPDRSVTQSRPSAPPAAPPQRTNRQPAVHADRKYPNSNRQPPGDSGNDDEDRSGQDSDDRPDRGRRKSH